MNDRVKEKKEEVKKEEQPAVKNRRVAIKPDEKPENVTIAQITAGGRGVVYGIGSDQKIYVWNVQILKWVLYKTVQETPIK